MKVALMFRTEWLWLKVYAKHNSKRNSAVLSVYPSGPHWRRTDQVLNIPSGVKVCRCRHLDHNHAIMIRSVLS